MKTGQHNGIIKVAQKKLKTGHYDAKHQADKTVFLNETQPVFQKNDAIKLRQGRFGNVSAKSWLQACFCRHNETAITVCTADTSARVFFHYSAKKFALWAIESQQLYPFWMSEASCQAL